jgi:hypothetical protein
MPKWTEYTTKDTLADNDEVMLYDATARANKRGLMSKFWDYVVDKMSTAVISKLETNNKTIIGAINVLNSETQVPSNFLIDGNFKDNATYIIKKQNKKAIYVFGIIKFPFNWTNYKTFGVKNINFETSSAFFYNLTKNNLIIPTINNKEEVFNVQGETEDVVIFYGMLFSK